MAALCSPDVRDGLLVFVVRSPDSNLVPFGSYVDNCATHVIAVVVERFPHQTQELRCKDIVSRDDHEGGQYGHVLQEQSLLSPTRTDPGQPCAAAWTA